jgi:molecular chaperone GrpE
MEEQKVKKVDVKSAGEAEESRAQESRVDEKQFERMPPEEMIEAFREQRQKADRNYDLYLRAMADAENIKKRAAKEKEDWIKYANENLIKSILPVIDNLEKAITHSRDESSLDALREGVELTLKGLKDSLGRSGVEEVEAEGASFDPRFHEAVYEAEHQDAAPGTVIQELQKGYTFNGRLLRPAMVVVSRGRAENRSEHSETREDIPREGSL